MREEYFMNYDFLRKHGDKIDQFGRNFRMLDFEDGGMYFGVVENDLPSGLGAFVYSDLKFHCGIYANGLMNGLSRIHFGNGDVYDGEADDGQMHGRGYFFDCENNDWVFGEFEGDNCTKVLESGEGFPRDHILKFRAMLHNAFPQGNATINKVTESLSLDLDILFEYAGKDIKLAPPEQDRSSANQSNDSHVRTENSQISQKTGNRRKEMDEFYKKTLASRELNKQPSKNQGTTNHTSIGQSYSKRDSSQASNLNSGNAHSSEALPNANPPAPQPKPKQPATATGQFQSNGSSANHNSVSNLNSGRSPNSQQSKKSTPGNQIVRDVHVVKPKAFQGYSSVGTGARSPGPSQEVSQQVSPNRDTLVAPQTYSRAAGGRSPAEDFHVDRRGQYEEEPEEEEEDEHEDEYSPPHLRDMSIQTEDQVRPELVHPPAPEARPMQVVQDNSETQLSYLKNIQNMVDELKQLVSDKMSVQSVSLGGGGASGGLMSPFATVLSGVHHKTSSQGVQVDMPSETRELIEKLDVLRGNLGLNQDSGRGLFAMPDTDSTKGNLGMLVQFETLGKPRDGEPKGSPGFASQEGGNDKVRLDWQGDIEAQLIELRAKQLEEAMAQRFGAVPAPSEDQPLFSLMGEDLMEIDENNLGEELEPIKESVDEDDEAEVLKPAPEQEQPVHQPKETQAEGSRAPRSAIRDNNSEPSHTLSPFTDEKIKELQDDSPWNPHQNTESTAKQQSAPSQKLLIQPLQNLVIDSRVSNFMDSKRGQDSQAGSFIPFESSNNKRTGDHPEFGSLIEGQLDHHLARKYSAPRNAEGRRSSQRDRSQSSNRSSRNVSSERSVTMRVPYWYFLNPYMYEVSDEVDFSDGVAPVPEQSLRNTKYPGIQSASSHKEGEKSSPNPRSLKIEEITLSLVSPGSENGLQAASEPQVREFMPEMRGPAHSEHWQAKNQSIVQEKRAFVNQSSANPIARPLPQPKPPLWPTASTLPQPGQSNQRPFTTGTSQLILPTQQHLPATGLLPGTHYTQQFSQVPTRHAS